MYNVRCLSNNQAGQVGKQGRRREEEAKGVQPVTMDVNRELCSHKV